MGLSSLTSLPSLGESLSSNPTVQNAASTVNNAAKTAANIVTGGQLGFVAWLTSAQGAAFILGIICIIAGLFTLKPTRDIVVEAGKRAGEVAAVA